MTKVQLPLWKVSDSRVAYHRTLSRQNLYRFLGRAQKFWNQFDEYDSRALHCVKQTSEKKKVRRLGKIQVKIPHQRSPHAVKFEDRSPEEIARPATQERCARGDARELARKIFTLKKKRKTKLRSVRLLESGFCRPHPQERPEQSRIWNREDIEKSDDGGDIQRRSANKRRGNGIRPRIWFIRDGNASWKYTGSSFTWKTLRRIWVQLPLDQWPETTSHQKWQDN